MFLLLEPLAQLRRRGQAVSLRSTALGACNTWQADSCPHAEPIGCSPGPAASPRTARSGRGREVCSTRCVKRRRPCALHCTAATPVEAKVTRVSLWAAVRVTRGKQRATAELRRPLFPLSLRCTAATVSRLPRRTGRRRGRGDAIYLRMNSRDLLKESTAGIHICASPASPGCRGCGPSALRAQGPRSCSGGRCGGQSEKRCGRDTWQ